jgi:hypothetical protein
MSNLAFAGLKERALINERALGGGMRPIFQNGFELELRISLTPECISR